MNVNKWMNYRRCSLSSDLFLIFGMQE